MCWVSVWSYVSLLFSNKIGFLWRHFLSFSLELCKFTTWKQKSILTKTYFRSQFEVTEVYEFQTKAKSSEDICWVLVWGYVSLWISNKSEFWWINFLSLSLKLCKFMSYKQRRILMKTFIELDSEVM